MKHESTAAAVAESSGPENQPLAVSDQRIAVRQDWTPAAFEAEVDREKQMRGILQRYMKEAMVKDHHFYSFKEGDKPALTQEGAHSICSLMKAVIGPPENREIYHDDGHLSVTSRVEIFNQSGERIATGDGICTTRESKYAYRWVWDNEVPNGVDKSKLKSKTGQKRGGGTWTQYQMPNQDLPDLYNTVLKMAVKRAKVAAVRQLPLVSELFIADDDGELEGEVSNTRTNPEKPQQTVPTTPQAVAKAIELAKKLVEKGTAFEDLAIQFLPEGVPTFEALSEEQATPIVPEFSRLLTMKVGGK
jgi:hypothetical protein